MARFVDSFSAQSLAALETAVNAVLAGLTNPSIRGFDLCLLDTPRKINLELRALLQYSDSGAVLATPFLLKTFSDTNLADVETAIQTFMDAQAAYFYGSPRLLFIEPDGKQAINVAWLIYNTTGGASANYLLL